MYYVIYFNAQLLLINISHDIVWHIKVHVENTQYTLFGLLIISFVIP